MLDKEKVSTWIRGQVQLESGDIVTFEFSPEKEHGGGLVNTKPAEGRESLLVTHQKDFHDASGILGMQLSKFMKSAKTMFSHVEGPKLVPPWVKSPIKPTKDSDG